ncbi:MAG: TlyA family RNA methyltransferase [Thermodesulfovibrionales bacterium]|nr:TlyA family RNA methyltransferase [Thermodesulfovibrionales bacterium]
MKKYQGVKERLDIVLFKKALAGSRERAKALIIGGNVLVDGSPVTKAGAMINDASLISLKSPDIPYVSRGGLKLEAAVRAFGIDLQGRIAMDVGASTGGFTDCLLQMGAKKVYSIDVGYGQFDWRLRQDARVFLLERTNIRYLQRQAIPDEIDIAAVDVSFISLRKVIPKVMEFLSPGGEIVALIKPQFEAGRADVGKGGIVRDGQKRLKAVEDVKQAMEELGMEAAGLIESPLKGQKGNIEYLIHLKRY